MKIIVASTNPVKQEAVLQAFSKAFHQSISVEGMKAPSGVSDQPMTDEETLLGARNRAQYCRAQQANADFWVGIEGGIRNTDYGMEAFGWMVILNRAQESYTRSASFLLPTIIEEQINEGAELGPAMDILFKEHNSKHKGGAVGLLSNTLVSREALYEQPLILALIPFLQPQLYNR